MTGMRGWMDAIIGLVEHDGAEVALSHVRSEGRRLCPHAWRDRWWQQPIGLVEDDEAIALDALEYAACLLDIGATGPARELVLTVIRAAVDALPELPPAPPTLVDRQALR